MLPVSRGLRSIGPAAVRFGAVLAITLSAAAPSLVRAAGYSDMVIDVNSGKILHETNADAARFPASLTKMMTLYVTFDMIEKKRLSLDTTLTISAYGASAQPTKLGQIGRASCRERVWCLV